jgi:hypothetical protein
MARGSAEEERTSAGCTGRRPWRGAQAGEGEGFEGDGGDGAVGEDDEGGEAEVEEAGDVVDCRGEGGVEDVGRMTMFLTRPAAEFTWIRTDHHLPNVTVNALSYLQPNHI